MYTQLKANKWTVEEIRRNCEISLSTIRRIIQSPKTLAIKYIRTKISRYSELLNSETLINFIDRYIRNTRNPFTWADIWRLGSGEFNITVKPHVIRRVIKKDFTFRYKKGSNRPSKLDEDRQKWLKSLFWLNLLQILKSVKILLSKF